MVRRTTRAAAKPLPYGTTRGKPIQIPVNPWCCSIFGIVVGVAMLIGGIILILIATDKIIIADGQRPQTEAPTAPPPTTALGGDTAPPTTTARARPAMDAADAIEYVGFRIGGIVLLAVGALSLLFGIIGLVHTIRNPPQPIVLTNPTQTLAGGIDVNGGAVNNPTEVISESPPHGGNQSGGGQLTMGWHRPAKPSPVVLMPDYGQSPRVEGDGGGGGAMALGWHRPAAGSPPSNYGRHPPPPALLHSPTEENGNGAITMSWHRSGGAALPPPPPPPPADPCTRSDNGGALGRCAGDSYHQHPSGVASDGYDQ